MLLGDLQRLCRDYLSDHGGIHFTDFELARYLDRAVAYAFRYQIETDKSYHNAFLNLLAADAVKVHASVFEWVVPRSVHRIVAVAETKDVDTFEQPDVFQTRFHSRGFGFHFHKPRRFRVTGLGEAKDITVAAQWRPARLHRGATPVDAPAANQLYLVDQSALAAPNLYDVERVDDAYRNAQFEIVGADSPTHLVTGQRRTCSASSVVNDAGTVRVRLTFEEDWDEDPDAGDTYDMHAEVDDAHSEMIVLMAVRSAWLKTHNTEGIATIQGPLREEMRRFIDGIKSRQDRSPGAWITEDGELGFEDPNRDPFLIGGF